MGTARGFAIAAITFVCLLLTELFTRAEFRDASYYQTHGWPKLVGFWVAAGIVYFAQSWFRVGRDRTVIDKETGQEFQFSVEDRFLGVPARYWPAILLMAGLLFYFVRV